MTGLFALTGSCIYMKKTKLTTQMLVYIALMLSLTIILHQLRLFHFPQGGSLTLGSMLPIMLISYRFGPSVGAMTGFLYGFMNLLLDPFILHPVQVIFDYPLPFMAIGLAGLMKNNLYLGVLLGFAGRFLCHFISGIVFFSSYAPEGMSPIIYSLTVNGSLIGAECLICLIIVKLLPIRRLLDSMGQKH
jgi:thiamine transporter